MKFTVRYRLCRFVPKKRVGFLRPGMERWVSEAAHPSPTALSDEPPRTRLRPRSLSKTGKRGPSVSSGLSLISAVALQSPVGGMHGDRVELYL